MLKFILLTILLATIQFQLEIVGEDYNTKLACVGFKPMSQSRILAIRSTPDPTKITYVHNSEFRYSKCQLEL